MESYDTLLLGSLFGLPAFKEHFGNNYGGKAGYQIAPGWQAGLQQVGHLFADIRDVSADQLGC
jgi:SP family general alpha glucoside:H+ symporter-like MFS transporter